MVPFVVLPKYTDPSRLAVRFSGDTLLSLILISMRDCALTGELNAIAVPTAQDTNRAWRRIAVPLGAGVSGAARDRQLPAIRKPENAVASVVANEDRSVRHLKHIRGAADR